jgi:hypothetical protein
MPANNLIQFRKGVSTDWSSQNPVLKSGEPGYSIDDNTFKIGDGVTSWNDLSNIGSATYSNYIISTGQSSFSTATGYTAGTLELYQNGVKLVNGLDFSATNGSTVTLSGVSPSGSILDYRIATVNVCAGSQGGGITYTAGTGLVLVGTEFNIDGSVMQTGDLSTSIAAGTGISLDYDSGTDVLTINATGGGSSYTGGTGIVVDSNNDINIDESVFTTGNLVAGSGLSKSDYTLNVDATVLRTGDLGTNLTAGTGVVFDEVNSDLRINVSFTGHPDVPAASSSNNSGSVVIQDVILDGDGHVTGLGTTNISELFTQGDGMILTTGSIGDIEFKVDPTVVRSGDNISDLNNDIGFITGFDLIASGFLASGDNVSLLANDAGYTTETGIAASGFITGIPDNINVDSVTAATGSFVTLRFGNDNITFPTSDGTANQYLETDGNGVLSFVSASSDSNTFVTGISYDDTTRIVTLTRNDGETLDTHLDELAVTGDNISIFVNDSGYINAHPAVDAASSSDNTGQTFVQDLLFDEFGHVTGVGTADASDNNTTYSAGSGLELNGTEFDVRAGDGIQISSDNVAVDDTVVRTTNTYENPSWLTSINANILSGEVPAANLPSYVDDVLEYNGTGNFPAAGETGKIYLDTSTNFSYRWGGSSYVQIVDGKATWGGIDGTLSNQTDLSMALQAKADATYANQNRSWIGANTTSGVVLSSAVEANDDDISNLSGLVTANDTDISNISGLVAANHTDVSNLSGLVGQNTASGLQNQTDVGTLSGLIDDLEAVSGAEQSILHSWNNTSAQLVSTLTPGNTAVQQLFEGKLYGDSTVTYLRSDVDLGIGTVPSAALHIKGEYGTDDYLMIEDTSSALKTKLYTGNTTSVLAVDEDDAVASSAFTIQVDGDNKGTFGASATTLDQSVTINASNNQCVFGNSINVLNEGGADVNFRVESTGNQNMLRVDAGQQSVNIGTLGDGASQLYSNIDETYVNESRNAITARNVHQFTENGLYYTVGYTARVEMYCNDNTKTNSGYALGINAVALHKGGGTVNQVIGVRSNAGGYSDNFSGVINNLYGFYTVPVHDGDGTITNGYGLYLNNMPSAVTNKWGVYQPSSLDNNYFNGKVLIGTTSVGSHSLKVVGSADISATLSANAFEATSLVIAASPGAIPLGVRSLLEDTTRVETLNVNGEYTFPTTDGTASGQVLVTDGAGNVDWEDQAGGGTSNVDRATLSLTSAQQTFSVSNGYDTGAIDVYLNGVKLADGTDFTATNGTSFVLTEAAASGDIVQYTTYDRLTTNGLVSDSGDTMTGDLTINANLAVTGTIDSPQAAKAWVNFNAVGTLTKRNDYNVTSVTDNGTGDYTVNFENSLPDTDYAVSHSVGKTQNTLWHRGREDVTARTVDAYRFIVSKFSDGQLADSEFVSVIFFGG